MLCNLSFSDVQTHSARDKSAWRKSNLNTSNSSEDAEADARRYRRQRSREGSITSISGSPLHSIIEEDKKKNSVPVEKTQTHSRNSSDSSSEAAKPLVGDSNLNKQSIYIRPPTEEIIQSPTSAKHNSSIYIRPFESDPLSSLEDQPNVPRRFRRTYLNETNNKIEIDSDNIETPPTTRKNFNHHPSSSSNSERTSSIASHKNIKAPRPLHKTEDGSEQQVKLEQEILGDGQFDRFSSARRTRRFRRPIDLSSATEDNATNATTTSPESISDLSFPILTPSNVEVTKEAEKVKSPIKNSESDATQTKASKNKVNNDVVSRIGKIGKSISRISQEDVREAIRSLKSPTPEREWNPKDSFRAGGPISSNHKIISHELNDEGFEETQSLVSDTPSLTTSSCNEEAKTQQRVKSSAESAATPNETPKRRPIRPSNQLQTLIARNQQSLERSRSLRVTAPLTASRSVTSTPRRTASLRRPETSQQALSLPKSLPNRRLDVERSNSRTSLRSSRSSLNSAVSTNTVKKMPLKPSTAASSVSSLPKKPLVLQNNSTSSTPIRTISRVPASRSSSSGSSIGL
jgi:inverted formin-2